MQQSRIARGDVINQVCPFQWNDGYSISWLFVSETRGRSRIFHRSRRQILHMSVNPMFFFFIFWKTNKIKGILVLGQEKGGARQGHSLDPLETRVKDLQISIEFYQNVFSENT